MELSKPQGSPVPIILLLVGIAVVLALASPVAHYLKAIPHHAQKGTAPIGLPPGVNITKNESESVPPIVQTIFTPPKTPEEIAEQSFMDDSYYVGQRFTAVFFETRLIRIGFFNTFDDYTNSTHDVLRADIAVKNIEPDPHNFFVDEGKVWYNLDNYTETGSNFTSNSIEPGEVRSAYVLFGTAPRSFSGVSTITIGTTRAYSPIFNDIEVVPYEFNISAPLLARPRTVLG